MRRRTGRAAGAAGLLVLLLAAAVTAGTPGGLAQEATPGAAATARLGGERPARVVAGGCDEDGSGAVVARLTAPAVPEGAGGGDGAAVPAAGSFSAVSVALDDLLADDHAIVVLPGGGDGGLLACGEIGGVVGDGETLAIGLKEQAGSGFSGIAFLAPGTDEASTEVSVFVAATGRGGGQPGAEEAPPVAARIGDFGAAETPARTLRGDGEQDEEDDERAAAGPTPTPRPRAVPVDVSLTEWAVDMPVALRPGRIALEVANDGEEVHSLVVEGAEGADALPLELLPGESATLRAELGPGTYAVYCPLGEGSHRAEGMELELIVE